MLNAFLASGGARDASRMLRASRVTNSSTGNDGGGGVMWIGDGKYGYHDKSLRFESQGTATCKPARHEADAPPLHTKMTKP